MRGIIFTELIELIESVFSEEMLETVLDRCQLEGAYTSVGNYSHTELLRIVGALSEETGVSARDLVLTFGEHLFRRFSVLYPTFFQHQTCPFAFLKSVEGYIHVEVLKLYPDASLPSIKVTDSGEREVIVEYVSHRPLADVAEALIIGCLKYFGADYSVRRIDSAMLSDTERSHCARFLVQRIE